jgi:hypothetical protein
MFGLNSEGDAMLVAVQTMRIHWQPSTPCNITNADDAARTGAACAISNSL